jgi:GT2 family glycosyltransferase
MTNERETDLKRSVTAFLSQADPSWELIVVDDTPTLSPTMEAFLAEHAGKFKFVRLSTKNLPRAGNVGITTARGQIVIFVDDDVVPSDNFVAKHVAAYTDFSVGGVMGRIRQHTFPEWEPDPGPRDTGFNSFWHKHFNWRKRQPVAMVRGCNMSFRRDVLFEVGGCDEQFVAEGMRWDTDLGYCVRNAGYTIMYDPDAWLEHLYVPSGGARTRGLDLKRTEKYYQNNFYFLFKHNPPFLSAAYYTLAVFFAGYLRKEVLRQPALLWQIPHMLWRGIRVGKRLALDIPATFLPAATPTAPDPTP